MYYVSTCFKYSKTVKRLLVITYQNDFFKQNKLMESAPITQSLRDNGTNDVIIKRLKISIKDEKSNIELQG